MAIGSKEEGISIAKLRMHETIPPLLNTCVWHCGVEVLCVFV
jgi:hypothetical protein